MAENRDSLRGAQYRISGLLVPESDANAYAPPREEAPRQSIDSFAILLGWRLAYVYSHPDGLDIPGFDTLLLPDRRRPEDKDELKAQLQAVASVVDQFGLVRSAEAVQALVTTAGQIRSSPGSLTLFRDELRRCHSTIIRELWARREALGKAYELGIALLARIVHEAAAAPMVGAAWLSA